MHALAILSYEGGVFETRLIGIGSRDMEIFNKWKKGLRFWEIEREEQTYLCLRERSEWEVGRRYGSRSLLKIGFHMHWRRDAS